MIDFRKITSGDTLTAVGVLHLSFGLVSYRETLGEMVREGLVDAVKDDPAREAAFWFLTCGASLVLTGLLAGWTERRTGTLPASTAPMLLGIGAVGVTLMPRSGFWALLVPAVLAFVASRRPTNGDHLATLEERGRPKRPKHPGASVTRRRSAGWDARRRTR